MIVQTNTPTTIEGVPFSTSETNRVTVDTLLPGYSAQWMPAPTPIGIPISAAMPTMISVPTMACSTPPPVSPAGTGTWVKNAIERELGPLHDQASQDHEQRHHRDEDRSNHQADHDVAAQATNSAAVHLVLPLPAWVTRQISSRAAAFTRTVMTKSTNATYVRAA